MWPFGAPYPCNSNAYFIIRNRNIREQRLFPNVPGTRSRNTKGNPIAELKCLEGLAILVSKPFIFCPVLDMSGRYGDLVFVIFCNKLVLWGWSVINPGVKTPFHWEALPTLWYLPKDTELALGMTLLEMHYILQVFCVSQEDGGGGKQGS